METALLPSGILQLPLELSGQLAYLFREEDGTDVVHLLGDPIGKIGEVEGQRFSSREIVAWISHQEFDGKPYRHIEMFLWRDAEVAEFAGTTASSPALFVTLDTHGPIQTNVDDFAFHSSASTQSYQDGSAMRKALAERRPSVQPFPLTVFDPSGLARREKSDAPKPTLQFKADGELKMGALDDGQKVISVIGGVYLSRGVGSTEGFLEIQADAVVVFLSSDEPGGASRPTADAGLGPENTPEENRRKKERLKGRGSRSPSERQRMASALGDAEVEGAYLEGDVRMSQGPHTIRASRLYYDFGRDRAILLDAVARTTLVDRNIPLYIRAAVIRQLSAVQYSAEDAILTTSEFHTPHYHVGGALVELINRTPADPGGRISGIRAGNFRIQDATLNVGGLPIAYWPSLRGAVDTSETAIRSVRVGYSDDFGAELETKWHLYNLLGLERPEGFDSTLSLDYFSERGPAIGIDAKYERDKYFGLLRSYLLTDDGADFLGEDREEPSPHDVRGRFLARHRQYLEDDWQLSLELSYISDKSFLEEFFESEFDNEKEQETLLYLKKQRENWALTGLFQWRLLDFTTQTERLPDWSFRLVAEPLRAGVTWYGETRLGMVRYRAADQTFREFLRNGSRNDSGTTIRADTRQEFGRPFDLGAWRLVPFATGRGSVWDDSPEDGGVARAMGQIGVRGSMFLSRVYPNVKSQWLDLDGLRHVIKPDFVAWGIAANRDSDELYAFDESVEGIDEIDGATFGIRQRWQTKRGEGDNRRTVDVFTWDLEAGAFNDASGDAVTNGYASWSRPEDSIARNYVSSSTAYRINDRTAILTESNFDTNDGMIGIYNLSLVVERTPRFSYLIGYRFIDASDSNLLAFDMNYRMTEKYTLGLRELFDLDEGKTLDFTVVFIRRHPRWFSALSFNVDEAEDDFGVSFSLWPEGLPQAALGSRRFTGLATSTSIEKN